MCRDKRADDSVPLDNISFLDEEDNIVEETNSNAIHKVQRSLIIVYIKDLTIGETNAAFITPIIAFKIVDFIYLISYRTAISPEIANAIIHDGFKITSSETAITPVNQRKKTLDEFFQILQGSPIGDVIID